MAQEVNPQSPLMAGFVQMMDTAMDRQREMFTKMLEERGASNRRPETVEEDAVGGVKRGKGGCSYKTFLYSKPPEFSGSVDPIVCMNWLQEIEQAFESSECGEDKKVRFASQMLRGKALSWWNVTRSALGTTIVSMLTWEMFKGKVMEKYCNERALDKIEDEFRALKKGSMSIADYSCTFIERLDLVGHLAPDERTKIKYYLKGLPADMKSLVRNAKVSTLQEAIEESQLVEDDIAQGKEEQAALGEKRKWNIQPEFSQKFEDSSSGKEANSRKGSRWCQGCRAKHAGKCNPNPMMCPKCGKLGHSHRDCPVKGIVCFECRKSGHVKRDCPSLKTVVREMLAEVEHGRKFLQSPKEGHFGFH